ncbi:MAG: energy-coupling factor ABC transporter ATP-binding protein, partial [Spirochaetota bacterium]
MIELKGVQYTYPNGFRALSGITVTLNRGDFILLTGWNGSGKTTFAKLLNGLLVPREGSIFLDGRDITGTPTSTLARRVGLMFQNPDHQLHKPTVREEIGFSLKNFGWGSRESSRRVRAIAGELDLVDVLESSPQELTSGEKKLVTAASVLVYEPDVVVVDEATANLDRAHTDRVVRMLERYYRDDRLIITISHHLPVWAESSLLNRVIVMEEGRISADGRPGDVFTNDAVMNYLADGVLPVTRIARELAPWGVESTLFSIQSLERQL